MLDCYQCNGTGVNRHSGYFCGACKGTGRPRFVWPLVVIVTFFISIAVVLYGADWLRARLDW